MTERRPVTSRGAPAAIGPYTQAIKVDDWVWTSGQIGLDPESGEMVEGGVAAQTERALQNLEAVLSIAGSSMQQAVRCTVYLVDMADFEAVNEVYAKFFRDPPPARSTVAVAGLPKGALVEVDCVAVR